MMGDVLVQCIAVNMRFLFTVFKEGAGNSFLKLTDGSYITNLLLIECHKVCW
jgi:hypothetical protein